MNQLGVLDCIAGSGAERKCLKFPKEYSDTERLCHKKKTKKDNRKKRKCIQKKKKKKKMEALFCSNKPQYMFFLL